MNIQSVVIFPFGETGNDIFNSLTGVLEVVIVKPAFLPSSTVTMLLLWGDEIVWFFFLTWNIMNLFQHHFQFLSNAFTIIFK